MNRRGDRVVRWLGEIAAVVLLAGAVGCDEGGGAVAGGGTGGSGIAGTGGGPGATSGSLAGVWEFWVTNGHGISSGSVELATDRFVLTVDDATFDFWEEPSAMGASYQDWTDSSMLTVSRTGAAIETGILPLPLGGTWDFADVVAEGSCRFSLTAEAFTATCADVDPPHWLPDLNTALRGTRVRPLASRFGDLGGEWRIEDLGAGESCTLTFEGSTFTADCSASTWGGGVTLTFEGDVGSGTVRPSGELSAHRL